ncbi:Uncharacterized protein PECH_006752 [Penicillium ucsense]|uniref:Uncharacterized protein n=2 Tax=Penicillium TaxID=5073 RepID=A0A8J8WI92_9EURO|nr:uncharacterized protein N7539_003082 [Penicillium diatomitis]KAF7713897.1 Uncharacterized protein PECM_000455 [Penicillium ucsense]KAF7735340.1 Uncharacterized protein PECH_006752 [Penicillium ucsense]KAJ5491515.1 hypothetical protein N7539_003082 [Penicillium diatomitis]
MFAARRSASTTRQLLRQTPRRFGSHSAHSEPVNESFGRSFYVVIGTIAGSYALYRASAASQESGSESFISSLVNKFNTPQEVLEQRNAIHTALLEKAAEDRHLFQTQTGPGYYELRQPELLNSFPPYNVSPGTRADLSAVTAHYQRQNQAIEQARDARMKDGKYQSVYE